MTESTEPQLTEFKRLNYFTGLFMTADDFQAEQTYHLEKRKLHNQGLHTPGILPGVGQELQVEEVQVNGVPGLTVRVLPGAALDGEGREIFLGQEQSHDITPGSSAPKLVYITLKYNEELADHVDNVEAPQYSGDSRMVEKPILDVITSTPDNTTQIELARINLQAGATAVKNPADPANPQMNEIDRRYVVWAGARHVVEQGLPPDEEVGVIVVMQGTRRDFAKLADNFPVPSASDVRHAAMTAEMLARTGYLGLGQIAGLLSAIAAVEQDVGQEILLAYPEVKGASQFTDYQTRVNALTDKLQHGGQPGELLTSQADVAVAARNLAEGAAPPVAKGGPNQSITVTGDSAVVSLDGSGSHASGARSITNYHWEETS